MAKEETPRLLNLSGWIVLDRLVPRLALEASAEVPLLLSFTTGRCRRGSWDSTGTYVYLNLDLKRLSTVLEPAFRNRTS